MSRIVQDNRIEAAPESVFEAICHREALSRWWTGDVRAEPVVGSLAEFGFYDRAIVITFRIEELEPAERIRWLCTQGPAEYLGSEVVFDLESADSATRVRFEHRRLKGDEGFLAHAQQSWARVLSSLRSYVETGEGSPISVSHPG